MIYGRAGGEVTILRTAILADVKRLESRNPDKQDKDAIKAGSYVVVKLHGVERLYHQAFLRASGGALEIGTTTKEADERARAVSRKETAP
jgi:NAD(P)H-flavin reductase